MTSQKVAEDVYEYGPLPPQHSPFPYAGSGSPALSGGAIASPSGVPLISPHGASPMPRSAVPAIPSMQEGRLGTNLFRLTGTLRWWILAMLVYAIAAIAFTGYVFSCPQNAPGIRVLPSGSLAVDQFLSGLLLSVVLTPAAIIVRKIATELALYYPFAIASRKPTRLDDIERLREGGLVSVLHLFRYSPITAAIQGLLLLVGAILVPVGTLMIFTGSFAAQDQGFQTVAMPLLDPNGAGGLNMWSDMDTTWFTMGGIDYTPDRFLNNSQQTYVSLLTAAGGAMPDTPYQLGPSRTLNLSYIEGVRYNGIVTFQWSSGCRAAKDEIEWSTKEDVGGLKHRFTFPDGNAQVNNMAAGNEDLIVVGQTHANLSTDFGTDRTDINSYTMYYAVVGTDEGTVNLDVTRNASSDIFESRQILFDQKMVGVWSARVACSPTFTWELSSCVYDGTEWTDCAPSPNSNGTALDTAALDHMVFYMTGLPTALAFENLVEISGETALLYPLTYDFSGPPLTGRRAPLLADWETLYGALARAIVNTATSGQTGAAQVPTVGAAARPAYLVRVAVLALVLVMMLAVPAAALLWLLLQVVLHRDAPLRKATILTAATAMRGPRWDALLHGGCAMGDAELARYANMRVRYGVDIHDPAHVGLADEVYPIRREQRYWGILGPGKEE